MANVYSGGAGTGKKETTTKKSTTSSQSSYTPKTAAPKTPAKAYAYSPSLVSASTPKLPVKEVIDPVTPKKATSSTLLTAPTPQLNAKKQLSPEAPKLTLPVSTNRSSSSSSSSSGGATTLQGAVGTAATRSGSGPISIGGSTPTSKTPYTPYVQYNREEFGTKNAPDRVIDNPVIEPQIILNEQQQQLQSDAISSVDGIMSGYSQLQSDAHSMGDEGLVAIAAQWDKMSQMLDGIEAQITSQIQGQMSGNDPAMQNAIKLIREEADRMRKDTLEELNARGLVQSGVYARALSDMNTNELSQVQSAVASRFGDLQTQLNSALMSLAQTRIGALGANQSAATGMMTNTQNNILNTGLAGLNSAITMRGQDLQNSQFNQQLSQNQNQYDSTMKYNYAGLNQNQSQFNTTTQQNQNQFNTTTQLNKDKMAQDNKQFYAQLSQQDKQFYDQMSSSQQMSYAQIAASQGAQTASNSVAADRLAWEKQVYNQERSDTVNATSKSDTYLQVGNAMAASGFIENSINKIVAGTATVDGISGVLRSGGYTQDAQKAILDMIRSDPGVQKKLNPTQPTSNYTPAYNSNQTGSGMAKGFGSGSGVNWHYDANGRMVLD